MYDALTALVAQQAGFEAVYLSSASIAYTRLGRSDIGLTTAGLLNSADTPLGGGSFVFSPGGSTGSTLVPVATGSITATATVGGTSIT